MQLSQWVKRALMSTLVVAAAAPAAFAVNPAAAAVKGPVKVFILLGQSNMFGLGRVRPVHATNSLEYAIHKKHLYTYLVNKSGNWAVQKGYRFVHVMPGRGGPIFKKQWDAYWRTHSLKGKAPSFMRILHNQWLTVKGHAIIGPEFGIGHSLGKVVHGPVLLLKSCIGNRSIGWDLLPPGSKNEFYTDKQGRTWEYAAYGQTPMKWIKGTPKAKRRRVKWYAGKEYDYDITYAKYVLANLSKFYPGAHSYKIMGFFFWQGDKDRYDAGLAAHYQKNLAAFIRAVRKSFHAPKAPFVLATLGQDIKGVTKGNDGLVMKGQFAVSNPKLYPGFKGNVATVYAHPLSMGGSSNGHYNGNAQTYMNVGLAMGKAMDLLLMHK